MTVNYTTLLGLAQPVTGTEANTWGDVVNDEITALIEEAVAGGETINVTGGNVTLTDTDGVANQARNAILLVTGTPGIPANIVAPSKSKIYLVKNGSDAAVVLKGSATTGVSIPTGVEAICFWNGSDFEIAGLIGPASSTDNAIARFDSTTGKIIQNSGVTIDDANILGGASQLNVDNLRLDGNTISSTNTNGNIAITPNGTGEVDISKVDIDGGTIDGTIIGGSTAAAGTFTSLSDSGNLTFTGTGNRITGDFSNATLANRVMFQNSNVNSGSNVHALPNGTSAIAGFLAYNNSDPTNASFVQMRAQGDAVVINSAIAGTGTYLPMTFLTGGSERMRIDTSGNVGIGTSSPTSLLDVSGGTVAPALSLNRETGTTRGVLRFGRNNAGSAQLAGVIRCLSDDGSINNGSFTFGTANASGTEVERMRITAAGNVGIGTSSPGRPLEVNGSIRIASGAVIEAGGAGGLNTYIAGVEGASGSWAFATNAAERMRIDSSGNLLVGTTSALGSSVAGRIASVTGTGLQVFVRSSAATAGRYWQTGMDSGSSYLVYNDASAGVFLTYGATSWSGTSDENLKTDLKPIEDAAYKISTLRAVTGRFKTDEESVSRSFLIAQDVQKVLPEAVSEAPDGNLGLAYTDVIPLLVASIQELKAELDTVKAELATLKGN